ncbi:uncharacterized protein EDB91DRAFT_1083511 [Suillus paluster]|uniref:uncharacterized protein n=1 Tax=Suillus paluster TaxID=48578 RepID=UPI001B87DF7F|nr:uncharacterized protein EDB91DRAFT_1083511 [Suillus paluster]KAG1735877.1 hypothetical protein EDB91DRAFT_1083511 [Suillus paluster]
MTAKEAWDTVTSTTIKHCWDHSGIQLDLILASTRDNSFIPTSTSTSNVGNIGPHNDPAAWQIIHEFASSNMSLLEAETHLQQFLTSCYVDTDWRPALKAVMDVEGDNDAALKAVDTLTAAASHQTGLKIQIPACLKMPA